MEKNFFELIQISIGTRSSFSSDISEREWEILLETSIKHALAGFLFSGVERIGSSYHIPKKVLLRWFAINNRIEERNFVLCERVVEVSSFLSEHGYRNCLLKGQGTARLYPHPERRQSGDIDIWADGGRQEIISLLQDFAPIGNIDIKHCDWFFFSDVDVEVHFIPTWFYNPVVNKKLQQWIKSESDKQFKNVLDVGYCAPTSDFNLVYSLIHIYRHLFDEGIGLRQLMDYYYILLNSTEEERIKSMIVLKSFRMTRFAKAVMYVMKQVFGLEKHYMLCEVSEFDGKFLLNEIMQAGNFGMYDLRNRNNHQGRFGKGMDNTRRNLKFIKFYPQEVLWAPFWKIWHFCWRKYIGYI